MVIKIFTKGTVLRNTIIVLVFAATFFLGVPVQTFLAMVAGLVVIQIGFNPHDKKKSRQSSRDLHGS